MSDRIMTPLGERPVVDADAEHCFGWCPHNRSMSAPFTRLTNPRPLYGDDDWLGNIPGHHPEGSVHLFRSHGRAYRLRFGAAQLEAA